MFSENIFGAIHFFAVVMAELVVLFFIVSTLVALAQQYVSEERIRQALTKRRGLGNVLGAAIGALTPFCSFSTIPVLVGLLRSGAPFGAAISFLFASPLANPVVLVLFLALFGWQVAALYTGLAFTLSVIAGLVWEWLKLDQYVRPNALSPACRGKNVSGKIDGTRRERLQAAIAEGWSQLFQFMPYLIVGVAVGSIIQGFVPAQWIASVAGPKNMFAIPVAALIGAPLYLWPETMLPIGAALIDKGMSIGALMALVVGGAGCSIPEVVVLGSVFKPRLLMIFIGTILIMAIVIGYIFSAAF